MVKMDACTGSAPYYEPLHNELIDAFTAKVDVAPRATFSSLIGKMSHTAQSTTDIDDTAEDSGQEECEQQASEDVNNDAFMASKHKNSNSTKKGYNIIITHSTKVVCICDVVLVIVTIFICSCWENSCFTII